MSKLEIVRNQWEKAFVAYCNGMPEEEIAALLGINPDSLAIRIKGQAWLSLKQKLAVPAAGAGPLPVALTAALDKLRQNREDNYQAFAELRDHAVEMVKALKEGRLKLKKHFFAAKSALVVEKEVDPGPGDWVNIATYLRTISDGTYRALGDVVAGEKAGHSPGADPSLPQAPAITIILPAAIAAPRSEKNITPKDGASQVIDLQEVV